MPSVTSSRAVSCMQLYYVRKYRPILMSRTFSYSYNRPHTYYSKQVLPKVIREERVATPHVRECTRLLRVLAVQCPLQTSPF